MRKTASIVLIVALITGVTYGTVLLRRDFSARNPKGASLSVRLVIWVDLRLAGWILTDQPVSAVFRPLRPFLLAGFSLTCVTGGLLFWALALRCYGSSFFWAKVIMLVLAGVNIAAYH